MRSRKRKALPGQVGSLATGTGTGTCVFQFVPARRRSVEYLRWNGDDHVWTRGRARFPHLIVASLYVRSRFQALFVAQWLERRPPTGMEQLFNGMVRPIATENTMEENGVQCMGSANARVRQHELDPASAFLMSRFEDECLRYLESGLRGVKLEGTYVDYETSPMTLLDWTRMIIPDPDRSR